MKFITQRAIADAQAVVVERREAAVPARMHVLLAEDNAVNQRIAVTYLRKCGCSVDVARNGLEAVEQWAPGKYDAVFMDCHMPELDGYGATERIREKESPEESTYIIAMTANAMAGDRERCLEAGMNDYVSKPISVAAIQSAIDRCCARGAPMAC